MANKIADLENFTGVPGFHFRKDIRGKLEDVTLPKDYHLISKIVQSGLLKKLELINGKGERLIFEE